MKRWLLPLLLALGAGFAAYQAVLLATPWFLMDQAIRKLGAAGEMGEMTHSPLTSAENQLVVRPSPDLLYSVCPFDLADGPLLVHAEPVPGRYSSISVFDARTDTAFVANDEQMAGKPLDIILAVKGQDVPRQGRVIRLEHARGLVLQRVLLADRSEFAEVDPLRRRTKCEVLK